MDWIKIEDQLPEDGAQVIIYFEVAKYKNLKGTEDEIFGHNMFYNKSGWLTDDVTHWMPEVEGMPLPKRPK